MNGVGPGICVACTGIKTSNSELDQGHVQRTVMDASNLHGYDDNEADTDDIEMVDAGAPDISRHDRVSESPVLPSIWEDGELILGDELDDEETDASGN